jgi:hypothetical protein
VSRPRCENIVPPRVLEPGENLVSTRFAAVEDGEQRRVVFERACEHFTPKQPPLLSGTQVVEIDGPRDDTAILSLEDGVPPNGGDHVEPPLFLELIVPSLSIEQRNVAVCLGYHDRTTRCLGVSGGRAAFQISPHAEHRQYVLALTTFAVLST